MTGATFIYFISTLDRSMVKIGFSKNPAHRLAGLSCWSPVPLEVLAFVAGTANDEHAVHARFLSQHSHREWFHSSPEMLDDIAAIARFGELPTTWRGADNQPNVLFLRGIRAAPEWRAQRSAAQKASWALRKRRDNINPMVKAYLGRENISAKEMNRRVGEIVIEYHGYIRYRVSHRQLDMIEALVTAPFVAINSISSRVLEASPGRAVDGSFCPSPVSSLVMRT